MQQADGPKRCARPAHVADFPARKNRRETVIKRDETVTKRSKMIFTRHEKVNKRHEMIFTRHETASNAAR